MYVVIDIDGMMRFSVYARQPDQWLNLARNRSAFRASTFGNSVALATPNNAFFSL